MTLSTDLKTFIKLIDDLKDCGIDNKISLPRIAVIGTQSAGKSSLLESIVGYDFLPRGEGVVTRRPLELRLIHINDENFKPCGIFQDDKTVYDDFVKIKQKIEEKTNEVAGQKKGIVEKPIILTIKSYECPDLSLVDLPGITRVPMKNSDQPENIEEITTNMTMNYIKDERTIILCVIPANTDATTSDALKLARKVDIDGKRTLGVLTKVDIMDKGTNALSTLKNEIISLQHGYVAVKNRSQADITAHMSVSQALKLEEEFFENHREYRNIPELVGTKTLSKRLSQLLHHHIRDSLPKIKEEIMTQMEKCDKTLKELGQPFPNEDFQKMYYLISKAKEVADKLKDIMEGKISLKDKDFMGQFQGYASFNLLISKFHKEKNSLFVNGLKEISPVQVILDIVEYKGVSLPGFLPKEIIEKKVQNELEKLKRPVKEFISSVKSQNEKVLREIFKEMVNVSGSVRKILQQSALDYLDSLTQETEDYIIKLIEIEKKMIWTSDVAYFMKDTPSAQQTSLAVSNGQTSLNSNYVPTSDIKLNKSLNFIKNEIPTFEIDTIKQNISNLSSYMRGKPECEAKLKQIKESNLDVANLVSEEEVVFFYEKLIRYYNVINRNLSDTVTKIIAVKLIQYYYEGLEKYLMQSINDDMTQLSKLEEDSSTHKRRATFQEASIKLKKSMEILQRFNLMTNTDF